MHLSFQSLLSNLVILNKPCQQVTHLRAYQVILLKSWLQVILLKFTHSTLERAIKQHQPVILNQVTHNKLQPTMAGSNSSRVALHGRVTSIGTENATIFTLSTYSLVENTEALYRARDQMTMGLL